MSLPEPSRHTSIRGRSIAKPSTEPRLIRAIVIITIHIITTYGEDTAASNIFPHYRPLWHPRCSKSFRQHRNGCKTPTATFRLTLHSLLLNAGSSPPAFFYARTFHLAGAVAAGAVAGGLDSTAAKSE